MPFQKIKSFLRPPEILGKQFFHDLRQANHGAIRLLAQKIATTIRRSAFRAGLSKEDVEELINDAVVITISKIRAEKLTYPEYQPVAYALGVGKKLIANRIRTKKPRMAHLEEVELPSDFDPEEYLSHKEREQLIHRFLARLGENCRTLIQLKYFRRLRDQEIIDGGFTPYHSVNSLKSKRSQCMKKLTKLVMAAGGKKLID